jgi:hypothetical protein
MTKFLSGTKFSRYSHHKAFPLNGIIGESFIRMLGKDITPISVSEVLQIFYSGSLNERMAFVFDMYDTNRDGSISKDDVRLLLSHVPCEKSGKKSSSHIMMDSQTEILNLIADCFKAKELLTLTDFTSLVLEYCSDIFIAVMALYRFFNTLECTYQTLD